MLEVIVALAISTLLLGAAGALIQSIADSDRRTRQALEQAIGDRANERVLRAAVLAADLGGGAPLAWMSEPGGSLLLKTRCPTARGWSERCTLTLVPADSFRVSFGANRLTMGEWRVESILLLQDASLGGQWVDHWLDSVRLPLAIAVVRRHTSGVDTVILRIGDRG